MTDWRNPLPDASFRKADLLDCSLCAFPARKRGAYAFHLRATFGIRSSIAFKIRPYIRYLDGHLFLPLAHVSADFNKIFVWDAPEFSIEGKLVAGCMHSICYTPVDKVEPELAKVDIRLGIKLCHPSEDETRIQAHVPLRVCRPTGLLSPPKDPFRSGTGATPIGTVRPSGGMM